MKKEALRKFFTFPKVLIYLTLIFVLIFSVYFFRNGTTNMNTEEQTRKSLGANTSMGNVTLYAADLDAMKSFYVGLVGLKEIESTNDKLVVGFDNKSLITIEERDDLSYPKNTDAGLYHTAILFSDKSTLAQSIKNILDKSPISYEGSSDHLVSEAFYFTDPEDNGVELYIDKPRSEWQWENGKIKMGTEYIDEKKFITDNLKEGSAQNPIQIGHVHLKVGDISAAKEFYVNTLGFDITSEREDALFVSAGGYHHHLGMNTWESKNAGKRKPSLGLKSFEVKVENQSEIDSLKPRLKNRGIIFEEKDNILIISDPWGNQVRFVIG